MKRWTIALLSALLPLALMTAPASAQPMLEWRPCADVSMTGFECAFLAVPRDWDDPAAGDIDLAMARHRSTGDPAARIGSLFFNPGGPGGSGLGTLDVAWDYLPVDAQQRFDLVTWDPRGVGGTGGLTGCPTVVMPSPPATGPVPWRSIQNRTRAAVRAANAACAASNPSMVPYMGTNAAVRDLDAMRQAVGDERLSYWAWSYGTRIAYAYALRFPDRLRALVLDGSVSPNSTTTDFAATYSRAADAALNLLFQRFPSAGDDYRMASALLAERPLRLSSTREYSRWDLDRYLEEFAQWEPYYGVAAAYLRSVVVALTATGDDQRAAAAAVADVEELDLAVMTGAPAVVQCLDYPQRPSPDRQLTLATRARLAAPITGWYRGIAMSMACEGLTLTPDPVPVLTGSDWDARLLLLGATLDAQTAYSWTVAMGTTFRASRTVTYVGAKHVTFGAAGSTCVDAYALDYLINLRLPPVNVTCPSVDPAT